MGDADRPTLISPTISEPIESLPTEPAPAVETPRYIEQRELGRGGIGRVALVHDRKISREVALKELHRGEATSPRVIERFFREARVTARLEHPGVVPVYDVEEGAPGFYTMRAIRGATLAERLRQAKDLGARLRLLQSFLTVCQTMAFAHARGVLHRDLKPSNVMIGDYGETIVLDWGLAKEHGVPFEAGDDVTPPMTPLPADSEKLTRDGQVIGTPAYMSPEQALGKTAELNEQADVWSLGVILYEILTGGLPFEREAQFSVLVAVARAPLDPVRTRERKAPPELAAIAERCLSRDLSRRYRDASEVADEVRRYIEGGFVEAHQYSQLVRFGRWFRRNRRRLAQGALALSALFVASVFALCWWRFGFGEPGLALEAEQVSAISVRAERERLQALMPLPENEGNAAVPIIAAIHGCLSDDKPCLDTPWYEPFSAGNTVDIRDPELRSRLAAWRHTPDLSTLRSAASMGRYQAWGQVLFPRAGSQALVVPILSFVRVRALAEVGVVHAELLDDEGEEASAQAWLEDLVRVGAHLEYEILIGEMVGIFIRRDAAQALARLHARHGRPELAARWEAYRASTEARGEGLRRIYGRFSELRRADLLRLYQSADTPTGLRSEVLLTLISRACYATPYRLLTGLTEAERAELIDWPTGDPTVEMTKLIQAVDLSWGFWARWWQLSWTFFEV